ncbi:probable L-ascorbate peroxidase 7, chloroplastic [Coccomyxa sp. Obi]|nr:probable L-ascorbate peroxidase 7, chloroplastic [Coccomyxa sp. Obi]
MPFTNFKCLEVAVNLLQPVADKYKDVSYADLYQMASVTAIEMAGGPHIPLRYGRKDAPGTQSPVPFGRLPSAAPPWQDGAAGPAEHLRNIFHRMGFSDQEHVVLAGGQTLGRCHPERSGFGKPVTKYTEHGPGKPGGSPWTPDWLTFNNNYFKKVKAQDDPDLIVLETDDVLFKEPGFRPFAEKYEQDQDAFFNDYTAAHIKLSELGVEWQGQPFTLEPEEQTPEVEEKLENLQVSKE